MNGFAIGFGVGMRYTAPNKDIGVVVPAPPEEDITDAILLEYGGGILLENGIYLQLEGDAILAENNEAIFLQNGDFFETEKKTLKNISLKKDKSYWNF